MNKLSKIAFIFLLLVVSVSAFAAEKSPYFSKSVVITQIYPHQEGYIVIYMANDLSQKEVYLPIELFDITNGSEVFYGWDEALPYMQIFWKNGQFSHVKLYLKEDYRDPTWGALSNPESYSGKFTMDGVVFKF